MREDEKEVCTYEAGSYQPDRLRRWEALWVERVEDVVGEGQCCDGVPWMRRSQLTTKEKATFFRGPVGMITTKADQTYKKAGSPPNACGVSMEI